MMIPCRIVDSDPKKTERFVATEIDLKAFLYENSGNGNHVYTLETSDDRMVSVGVGNSYGFVEVSGKNSALPYLLAIGDANPDEVDFNSETNTCIEFDCGGTPTPIPMYACLPFDLVVGIVVDFFTKGEVPDYINWQEI